jgi:hypothetical protein
MNWGSRESGSQTGRRRRCKTFLESWEIFTSVAHVSQSRSFAVGNFPRAYRDNSCLTAVPRVYFSRAMGGTLLAAQTCRSVQTAQQRTVWVERLRRRLRYDPGLLMACGMGLFGIVLALAVGNYEIPDFPRVVCGGQSVFEFACACER